jgi:cell division protein FtsB
LGDQLDLSIQKDYKQIYGVCPKLVPGVVLMSKAFQRIAYVSAFALIVGYAYVVLRGPQGIPVLMEKRQMIRDMQEHNATLERENQYRRDRIQKLSHSSAEQEMEIRKQLHMLRQGETSFILPEAPKQPESSVPAQTQP